MLIGCEGNRPGTPRASDGQPPAKTPSPKVYEEVIQPQVAGSFYPKDPDALRAMIKEFFDKAPDITFSDNLLGFMSPHAGYVYSGSVAAIIFKNIPKGRFKKVVIIFPSHWQQFRGVLALYQDAYRTPLGDVPIDRDTVKKLIDSDPSIFWRDGLYRREHSGEVILPFLQESMGMGFQIIPLMMGDQNPNMARRLAEILHKELGGEKDILYIASSDMSHYKEYKIANAIDAIALNQIMHLDPDALVGDFSGRRAELCGYGPVLTLMHLSKKKGATNARILKYLNSGDTNGNKERVVGYGAVEFYRK